MANIFDLYEDLPPTGGSTAPIPTSKSTSTTSSNASNSNNTTNNTSSDVSPSNQPAQPPPPDMKKLKVISEWSAEAKLLGSQLKRQQIQQKANQNKRNVPAKPKNTPNSNNKSSGQSDQSVISTSDSFVAPMYDEDEAYDPSKPNDYLQIKEKEESMSKEGSDSKDDDTNEMDTTESIPPEPAPQNEVDEPVQKKQKPDAPGMNAAVLKMMAKMGYKEGQGLGRTGQGIINPLEAKKTRTGGAIIVGGEVVVKKKHYPELSRVVILTNIIGRGEVDPDLQGEIEAEARKFGLVERAVIIQDPSTSVPDEEAVRIYIKFNVPDDAEAARLALHGRFFGGRTVVARYFEEELFLKEDFEYFPPPAFE